MLIRKLILAGLLGLTAYVQADSVIMFNEIMYHPANDTQELEFVEIYNTLSFDMDISFWKLDAGIEYTFPEGTILPSEGVLVIAKSPPTLEAASGISGVLGPYIGQLANGGESIRLKNNSGRVMDAVDFGDGGEWPVGPDGSGASLAKINPFTASAPAINWQAGGVRGTPGGDNFELSEGGTILATTLISKTATWAYRDLGTDPGMNWMLPSYNDSSWSSGPSVLGYGDIWTVTTVSYGVNSSDKYPTTYFRHHFNVADPMAYSSVRFSAMMDDGAILYLNGTEFARVRVNSGTITYQEYSNDAISGGEENAYELISLPPNLLQVGSNVLAAEVHQASSGSSDLAFSVELIGEEILMPPASNPDLLKPPLLVFNEMAGVTNSSWWIELKNDSDSLLNPSGYVISVAGDSAREYILPGSLIPAGGLLLLTVAQLGFTAVDEEPIFLIRPGGESVADARVAKRSLRGRSGEAWFAPSVATPGATNHFALNRDIVINEIMYHHQPANTGSVYTESYEEWIELYNRGSGAVDLSGWKFEDGVCYDFPPGTTLAPANYLVVSTFAGTLANGGERILLVDAAGNSADEVHYFDGGRWAARADGNGSSLELRDPFSDNSIPGAWAASDESAGSSWQTYSYQVTASESLTAGPDTQWQDFVLGLLDTGEVLLDDISVIEDPGGADTQLISTRDFESGSGDWRIVGNHRHSDVVADPDDAANQVLRLVATGATDHMHNHAEITLADDQSVDNGMTYQISFRANGLAARGY